MKQKSYIFAKNYHMNTRSEEPQTISLQRIKALAAILDEQEYGNDVIIGEASGEQVGRSQAILRMLQYPVRFDGYIIFCLKKAITLDLKMMLSLTFWFLRSR